MPVVFVHCSGISCWLCFVHCRGDIIPHCPFRSHICGRWILGVVRAIIPPLFCVGLQPRPLHPCTLSPVHPLIRSPSHPFTLSPVHPLIRSPSHPLNFKLSTFNFPLSTLNFLLSTFSTLLKRGPLRDFSGTSPRLLPVFSIPPAPFPYKILPVSFLSFGCHVPASVWSALYHALPM